MLHSDVKRATRCSAVATPTVLNTVFSLVVAQPKVFLKARKGVGRLHPASRPDRMEKIAALHQGRAGIHDKAGGAEWTCPALMESGVAQWPACLSNMAGLTKSSAEWRRTGL